MTDTHEGWLGSEVRFTTWEGIATRGHVFDVQESDGLAGSETVLHISAESPAIPGRSATYVRTIAQVERIQPEADSRWASADPCRCYSCDRQCGGTVHPSSCGPVELRDGNLICEACRDKADVFSTPESGRKGLKVEIDQDAIRLDADVFGNLHGAAWLTEGSARSLARELIKAADDLAALNSACWAR